MSGQLGYKYKSTCIEKKMKIFAQAKQVLVIVYPLWDGAPTAILHHIVRSKPRRVDRGDEVRCVKPM